MVDLWKVPNIEPILRMPNMMSNNGKTVNDIQATTTTRIIRIVDKPNPERLGK